MATITEAFIEGKSRGDCVNSYSVHEFWIAAHGSACENHDKFYKLPVLPDGLDYSAESGRTEPDNKPFAYVCRCYQEHGNWYIRPLGVVSRTMRRCIVNSIRNGY